MSSEMNKSNEEILLSRYKGSLIGMAAGDAYGTTFEFIPRHAIKNDQLLKDDYMGGGKFKLMNGMFTDDTSLALIQSESLLDFYSINFSDSDISDRFGRVYSKMEAFEKVDEKVTCLRGADIIKKSLNWYNNGHFSANGSCFDIGATTLKYLLHNYKKKQPFCLPKEIHDDASGNGALMRLTPVPLYFYSLYLRVLQDSNTEQEYLLHRVIEESGFSSMTTHPSQMSIDCNRYLAALIIGCLQNTDKNDLLKPLFVPKGLPDNYWDKYPLRKEIHDVVFNCDYKTVNCDMIKNSGFSVKSLESALWAFHKYDNFMDGLMGIVRLGDDSDTVAAIYGQLAGCYYKLENIPEKLVNKCVYSKFIQLISRELQRGPMKSGENSSAYIGVMKIFDLLESEYLKIDERINPSPNQYKNTIEFKEGVTEMEKNYLNLKQEILENDKIENEETDLFNAVADSLLNDFLIRCNDYVLPKLTYQFQRSSTQTSLLAQINRKK
jgi:ADP-ribosyl-[dinitrogen reductase] hydrolase